MDLIKAWNAPDGLTENGALTYTSTGDAVTNLFFQIGAFRTRDEASIIEAFRQAFVQNPLDAMRILFYSRDVRGGQGERRIFRVILRQLATVMPEVVQRNLALVSEYGRIDDLFCLAGTPLEDAMLDYVSFLLKEDYHKLESGSTNISLTGKWAPSEGSKSYPGLAKKLMRKMGLSPKAYRLALTGLRAQLKVVEIAMCSQAWDQVNYQQVPSYAMKNYRKAFARHDTDRWTTYLAALLNGEAKVNAATLFPHDLIRQRDGGAIIEQQWAALPNYMSGSQEIILPMCDVSGSMTGLPMEVSVSLGLYISERNESIFKNTVLTFTDVPQLFQVGGKTLSQRYNALTQRVGYNTNLDLAFATLLEKAVKHEVPADKMPTMILVLSDMEFDNACIRGASVTAFEATRQRYAASGYALPKIVYWNLAARNAGGNFPVKQHQTGAALVSGFSPSILKQLLSGTNNFTPEGIMRLTIDSERYSAISV